MSSAANVQKTIAQTSLEQTSQGRAGEKSVFPLPDSSTPEITGKLLPLMRQMEKARKEWQQKYDNDGSFDMDVVNKMLDLRQQLIWSPASSNLDLLIQCTTLQSVASFAFELSGVVSETPEEMERQSHLSRETIAEIALGLRAMQASLERTSGLRANDFGLFSDFGTLN